MEIIYFILIANCIRFHTVSLFLFSTAKLEKKETECNLIKLDFSIILTIEADKSVRPTECRNTRQSVSSRIKICSTGLLK